MNVRLGLIEKGYPRDLEPTQKYKIISPFFKAEHTKS